MSKIVGIDLGTTNSVIAVFEGGEAQVITSVEGARTVPSVVAFNKNGERLVGQTAKRQATINPENTLFSVKRFIGRRFDDEATAQEAARVPFQLVAGPRGDIRVHVPAVKRDYSAQEVSAMVLGKLKRDAEEYLGAEITQAVITVPAYFNDAQRQATKDAGKIAGLEVLRIINEPTAAALAYGLDKQKDETILVVDLGGGTFDVSVLEVSEGVIEVLATNGDTHLGGDDWDNAIVDWIVAEFKRDQGIDLAQDRQALQRIREAAEKAKIELSTTMNAELNLPFITADASGPKHLQLSLSRAKFEQLSAPLVERLVAPVEQALRDANIAKSVLDSVVLVGGSTRIPQVQAKIEALTGQAPNKSVNPDEVVALGAALQAGVLAGEVDDVLLLDVTPLSLGLETLGGVMTTLIPRNTTIPTRKSEVFSTAEDGQTSVDVHVLQGERSLASDNATLGVFRLDGIPAAPRGVPQVEVTFDIDANGILSVTAQDKASGVKQEVTIEASSNLSQAEIDRMVQDAAANATEDRERRELIEARNVAEQVVYQAEKNLEGVGDKAPAGLRTTLTDAIASLQEALSNEDKATIQQRMEAVQQASLALGEAAASASTANTTNGSSGGSTGVAEDDDVIEGEFEAA